MYFLYPSKGYKWTGRWRGTQGKVQKGLALLSLWSWGAYHPPSTWMCSPIQKLWISLLSFSIEFSLQCTCPFPWRLGVGLKVPLSNDVVFLVSGLILRFSGDATLSYLTSINAGVVKRIKDLIIKEIPRVLRVLYQEEWTKCLYFIISKAVTDSDTCP